MMKTMRTRCPLVNHISDLSREQLVAMLTDAGIQCYDTESDDVLREAIRVNVQDGTIRRSYVISLSEAT